MAAMLLGLPLAGILLSGREVDFYLQFPPLTHYVRHAPFSWPIFMIYAAMDLLAVLWPAYLLSSAHRREERRVHRTGRLPVWGWLGLVIMLAGWLSAWTRMAWLAPLQQHTFVLPWFGYILLVNALCVRRTGQSLLTDAPARFWVLFPVSALFWWFFEYLNRFVQNWYYVGMQDFGPPAYAAFATLAFATVLPAVLSTHRLLLGFSIFNPGLREISPVRLARPRAAAAVTLLAAAGGLLFLGVYPDWLFAFLWISPLLIITALQALGGRATIFKPLQRGDWGPIVTGALAALICGFFWEMWNFGSLAQWRYALPYVDRYRIFAMPLLGYGGYLPFGLECLAVGAMVLGHRPLGIDQNLREVACPSALRDQDR
ncbi:MAG: hypothetical protein C4519_26570 [Desulfobacteraceae bacterium]|nr:MAG: hypothetical protein C4519_26570 [Desulfobacteraceae bacterium]